MLGKNAPSLNPCFRTFSYTEKKAIECLMYKKNLYYFKIITTLRVPLEIKNFVKACNSIDGEKWFLYLYPNVFQRFFYVIKLEQVVIHLLLHVKLWFRVDYKGIKRNPSFSLKQNNSIKRMNWIKYILNNNNDFNEWIEIHRI